MPSEFAALYDAEWDRQRRRADLIDSHLPVHRWYLRHGTPWTVDDVAPPRADLKIMRGVEPSIQFYRFLYHTVGQDYLWGDRRRMDDATLLSLVQNDSVHVMVLYQNGVPAGFYELVFDYEGATELAYFGLLPGFTGGGLGSYLLTSALTHAGRARVPLNVNTCSLDHRSALENYMRRGFYVVREDDELYPDPRLDGTIPAHAAAHIPSVASLLDKTP
ncbi:MAG: GNAT family N-acetyltransferase [Pseudomonadota bacterium]